MDILNLTKAMSSAHLSDETAEPEQLLFNPRPDIRISKKTLQNIPRYLFRVVSPKSAGETNEEWVHSHAALFDGHRSTEDIFSNLDSEKKIEVAQKLNSHLRWKCTYDPEDNFVSWTSSLLFAIQYIYYRHLSFKDGSALEKIQLYVIDTTMFLQGTFMRDLDLINIFCDYDADLENLQCLRTTRGYYFGEYLSQGSLKIEGKCQVIPADILFDQDRLRRIQPEFAELRYDIEPEWANAVLRLRRAIWPPEGSAPLSVTEIRGRLQAIKEIVRGLDDDWTIPISIHFAALIGSRAAFPSESIRVIPPWEVKITDQIIFLGPVVPNESRPVDLGLEVSDALPELQRVYEIVSDINAAGTSQD